MDDFDGGGEKNVFASQSSSPSFSSHGENSNHEHFGKDLSGFAYCSINSYGIISNFHSTSALKTPTSGSKNLFLIESLNLLTKISLKKRHQINLDGVISFIELSHLCKFAQCTHGSVAVYHLLSMKGLWKLGIISGFFPMNNPLVVDMFEWTGTLASFGVPNFVSRKSIVAWSEISAHFSFCEFHPKDVEIIFVSQSRGIPIGNNPISPTT